MGTIDILKSNSIWNKAYLGRRCRWPRKGWIIGQPNLILRWCVSEHFQFTWHTFQCQSSQRQSLVVETGYSPEVQAVVQGKWDFIYIETQLLMPVNLFNLFSLIYLKKMLHPSPHVSPVHICCSVGYTPLMSQRCNLFVLWWPLSYSASGGPVTWRPIHTHTHTTHKVEYLKQKLQTNPWVMAFLHHSHTAPSVERDWIWSFNDIHAYKERILPTVKTDHQSNVLNVF